MSKKQEITAIIVARKGSKRIPSKNMLDLGGEPMLVRKIRQLKQCQNIDRIVFGSDSEEMLALASDAGAEVVRRGDFYCDENLASANDMIFEMCSKITTDVVVWAHCTNPLISPSTYDAAVQKFQDCFPEHDSLLSVVELKEHLWSAPIEKGKPLNYNPYASRHTPARALPPLYMQDGGIFIQPHAQMLANKYFFGKHPQLFLIPADEFLDINTMRDYLLAKSILSHGADGGGYKCVNFHKLHQKAA